MVYLVDSLWISSCPYWDILLIAASFLATNPPSLYQLTINESIWLVCGVVYLTRTWVKRTELISIIVEVILVSYQIIA